MTESKNIWSDFLKDQTDETTDQVMPFLTTAAEQLGQATSGKVLAKFHKQSDYTTYAGIAAVTNEIVKAASYKPSNDPHEDANDLYRMEKYVFDILNDSYRFTLFELTITPYFPITMTVDEGVYHDVRKSLSGYEMPDDKRHSIEIGSQNNLKEIFETLLQSKKLKYLVTSLMNG